MAGAKRARSPEGALLNADAMGGDLPASDGDAPGGATPAAAAAEPKRPRSDSVGVANAADATAIGGPRASDGAATGEDPADTIAAAVPSGGDDAAATMTAATAVGADADADASRAAETEECVGADAGAIDAAAASADVEGPVPGAALDVDGPAAAISGAAADAVVCTAEDADTLVAAAAAEQVAAAPAATAPPATATAAAADTDFPTPPPDAIAEERVRSTIKALLNRWAAELGALPESERRTYKVRAEYTTCEQTVDHLRPLLKRLRKRSLPRDILRALEEIFAHVAAREYVRANDRYLRLAIGNAPWPMGATMVGIHARSAREKIGEGKVAHVMNDEETRKYITAIKRLVTLAQKYWPTVPSKMMSS